MYNAAVGLLFSFASGYSLIKKLKIMNPVSDRNGGGVAIFVQMVNFAEKCYLRQ